MNFDQTRFMENIHEKYCDCETSSRPCHQPSRRRAFTYLYCMKLELDELERDIVTMIDDTTRHV